jgi:hypothetical protein
MKLILVLLPLVFIQTVKCQAFKKDKDSIPKIDYDVIVIIDSEFIKDKKATFFKRSEVVKNVEIFFDKDYWGFQKPPLSDNAEFRFISKSKEVFAQVLSEPSIVDLEIIPERILENALKYSLEASIISKEYRIVNGTKIMFVKLESKIDKIPFIYLTYAYSGEFGTVQFSAYTTKKIIDENSKIIESFLNGLTIIN